MTTRTVSPYTLRLPDGVPMAFPRDYTRADILSAAQRYADQLSGSVQVLHEGSSQGYVRPRATRCCNCGGVDGCFPGCTDRD